MTDALPVLETPDLPGARVSCLFAKTGHGKTACSLERMKLWPRSLALDTKARHTGQGEYPGMVAWTPKELARLLEDHQDRPRWRISYRGAGEILRDPSNPAKGSPSEPFFSALARLRNYLLIIEEAERYMTASYCPDGLFNMVRQGRTIGQAVTVCAHRPADVARKLTSVADEVVVWPCQEPADRDVLRMRGFDFDLLDTLKGHESLRLHAPEGERTEFYVCRCRFAHAGHCGEPLPRPPLKVGRSVA